MSHTESLNPNNSNAPFRPTGTLAEAILRTEIDYDYYTPSEIRDFKPTYVNEGNMALKGIIHSLEYDEEKGLYVAKAALGNAAAHDNLREVAGAVQQFGYKPPERFAHDFGGIYTHWYPRIDKTHVVVAFDNPRSGATVDSLHEGSVIADALGLRLEYLTAVLGRSMKLGIMQPHIPIRDMKFSGDFEPRLPSRRDSKSIFAGPH